MFTRKQYLNNECTHSEYYSQFLNDETKSQVLQSIGLEAINNSKDEHMNDIPLKKWDAISGCVFSGSQLISRPRVSKEIMQKAIEIGEGGISPATMVSIYKEQARQLKDK